MDGKGTWMGRGHERGSQALGGFIFLNLDAGYLDLFTS